MLQEADAAMTQVANTSSNPLMDTGRLWVRFEYRPVPDPQKSDEAGRPIFVRKEYIKIIAPGDKDNIIHREVMDLDRQRWPDHYAKFKAGEEDQIEGTPLAAWPGVTTEQVEEFKYFKIFTVEALAEMPDVLAQKFLGVAALRQRAKDYLAVAKNASAATKLRGELEARDSRIAALEKQIEDLGKKMDAQSKK
jgi:hypothetical protein